MKVEFSYVILLLLMILESCHNATDDQVVKIADNDSLKELYLKDLEIRELDSKTDTVNLENYDKVHRAKVFEWLANNQIKTPMDKYRAALILQHTRCKNV